MPVCLALHVAATRQLGPLDVFEAALVHIQHFLCSRRPVQAASASASAVAKYDAGLPGFGLLPGRTLVTRTPILQERGPAPIFGCGRRAIW